MIKNAKQMKVIRLDPIVKTLTFKLFFCAGLAQLVEQLTLNQLVRGSSPRRPTKYSYCKSVLSLSLFNIALEIYSRQDFI